MSILKRIHEEQCGRVALETVAQTSQEMNAIAQKSSVMSCGGVYVPRTVAKNSKGDHYEFIHLPSREKAALILKDNQLIASVSSRAPLFQDLFAEKPSLQPAKKMIRQQLN